MGGDHSGDLDNKKSDLHFDPVQVDFAVDPGVSGCFPSSRTHGLRGNHGYLYGFIWILMGYLYFGFIWESWL